MKHLIEQVCRHICRSGAFETGRGTCAAICMEDFGDQRTTGCSRAAAVHKVFALQVIEATLTGLREMADQGSIISLYLPSFIDKLLSDLREEK